ncbi:metallophosphoesterase [Actinorhabdospora filicis]|uniref:Metallophosphoesterase n=1 Tax=Actinorhabdospora filicis TaxID=1785913 RepID=A0A9W6SQ96_9ACTN|nr:metallophosphoesterase [Actinorhabdospora filicis]GLZ80373.1 metallophosphoesterase [Actinorhabdospora filicis]
MRKRRVIAAATVLAAAGAATLAYASLYERLKFTLRRFDVPVLAPDAEPLRVLQISDLHMTPNQRLKQDWTASLAALDPDLVLLTGDNLAHPDAVPGVARALEPLFDYPGAFVFGSNDYFGPVLKNPFGYFNKHKVNRPGTALPTEDLRALLTGGGWVDLNNARTTVKAGGRSVELSGVDDPHIELDDYDAVAGPASPDADVRIGVTHAPVLRILDAFEADGFDLITAGHTHGGQVCVPFYGALVTNCDLDRARVKGLHRHGESYLHVSAGMGTSPTAPVRFACPPEASVLTLVPRG